MRRNFKFALATLALTALVTPCTAADSALLVVNGVTVPPAIINTFMAQAKANGAPDTPELKTRVRDDLIRRELVLQEAKKTGIDKRPDVANEAEGERQKGIALAEAAKQAVIIRAYMKDFLGKNPIGDAQLKASYEAMRRKGGKLEYKARQILLKTEGEAKAVIAKLEKGDKFEDLAKESIDQSTRLNGGDLGWASPAKLVKPVGDALNQLAKGKFTETPIKTDNGYYVVRLDDTRPLDVPAFETMKPLLLQQAQDELIGKMLADLRAKAKIK